MVWYLCALSLLLHGGNSDLPAPICLYELFHRFEARARNHSVVSFTDIHASSLHRKAQLSNWIHNWSRLICSFWTWDTYTPARFRVSSFCRSGTHERVPCVCEPLARSCKRNYSLHNRFRPQVAVELSKLYLGHLIRRVWCVLSEVCLALFQMVHKLFAHSRPTFEILGYHMIDSWRLSVSLHMIERLLQLLFGCACSWLSVFSPIFKKFQLKLLPLLLFGIG